MDFVVLDDERCFIDDFIKLTAKLRPDANVKGFDDEQSFLEHLTSQDAKPDCVFVDIRLGSSSGIDTAQRVHELAGKVPVVFVTGYPKEYCQSIFLEHFDFEPFAFVCKPVEKDVLRRVFKKINDKTSEMDTTLTLRSGKKTILIDANEISYIESNRWYLIVHTDGGDITMRTKISDILGLLPEKFVVAHKSYVVNADCVRSFDSESVTLDSGKTLPVSRSRKHEFKQRILSVKGFAKC